MRIKTIFTLLAFFSMNYFAKAQCTATQTVGMTVSNTVVLGPAPVAVKICPTGYVYDTLNTSNAMYYYLEPGAKLYMKRFATAFIYMQSPSTLTVIGTIANKFVYREAGVTINSGTMAVTGSTCSVASFPASPSCSTGIDEKNYFTNLISVYPNPASDHITIVNDNKAILNGVITNKLGQKVKKISIENGNTIVETSDLGAGIYFLNITEKNKLISTQKIIITK